MAPPDLNSVPRSPWTDSGATAPTVTGNSGRSSSSNSRNRNGGGSGSSSSNNNNNNNNNTTNNNNNTTAANATSNTTSSGVANSSRQQTSMPSSRRTSQIFFPMNPPPLPLGAPATSSGGGSTGPTINAPQPFPPLSPGMVASMSGNDGGSNLPMRHPRPLTAAELHLELEKEQEAVVNRLTRELTALRAHSASVASTASSTSTAPNLVLDPSDPTSIQHPLPLAIGPTHPTASRQHRSSSNASAGLAPLRTPSTLVPSAPSAPSSAVPTTLRFEDVAFHRQELDEAKRENERLRRRVRELEAMLRGRRASSVSTSTSEARGRTTESKEPES